MASSSLDPSQNEKVLADLAGFGAALYHFDRNRRLMLFGTGFFVRNGGTHFLVSAAHVLDQYDDGLYYYRDANTLRRVEGTGLTTSSKTATRHDDIIDIGTLRLPDDGMLPYPAVIDIAGLRPHFLPRAEQRYAMVGFPLTRHRFSHAEKKNFVTPSVFVDITPVPDDDYAGYGFTTSKHVLLRQDLSEGYAPDGSRLAFPKPQGMSGGPVFSFNEKERVVRVVAVATAYRKRQKLFIATDISYVLDAVQKLAGPRA